jgi:hypothetical protein
MAAQLSAADKLTVLPYEEFQKREVDEMESQEATDASAYPPNLPHFDTNYADDPDQAGETFGLMVARVPSSPARSPARKRKAEYSGVAKLPKRVVEGDSVNLSLVLDLARWVPISLPEGLDVREAAGGNSILLHMGVTEGANQFLEVEMIGTGFEVKSSRKQRQAASSHKLAYYWACGFPELGRHDLTLVLRLLDGKRIVNLGAVEHHFEVVKVYGLKKSHITALKLLATAVTSVLGMFVTLDKLGLWKPLVSRFLG